MLVEECTLIEKQFETIKTIRYMESLAFTDTLINQTRWRRIILAMVILLVRRLRWDFAWPCEKPYGLHKILHGNTILPQRECEANRWEIHLHRAVLTLSWRNSFCFQLTSTRLPNFLQVFQWCHRGLKLFLIRLSVFARFASLERLHAGYKVAYIFMTNSTVQFAVSAAVLLASWSNYLHHFMTLNIK